ncbi:MAG: glycoside-pentoside-hexuronide (GPH):cation symporter [Ardenticatenaceae bacterium]|nr:glycoside-pentoside-hexuronide (GPH):cation symporter [Ardenticatenaceae bacterium]
MTAAQIQKRTLSLSSKLAYGTGDLGPAMVSMIKGFFLLNFLINIAGLPPGRAGLVLLVSKIWDAVNDPLVGTLTDRTRTRWGRRRPWLLFGSIPFALAFVLHFIVPPLSPAGLFIYYVIVAMLLDAGFTAVNVPYAALTPELSQNEQDRTDLNMYRFSFSVLGGLVAAVMYNTIVNSVFAADPQLGNLIQGVIVAVVIVASNIIVFAYTSEKDFSEDEPDQIPYFQGLKIALSSVPFLYVTGIYMLTWVSIQFVQSLILFFFRDWVGGDPGTQFTLLLFGLQLSIFVFILMWGNLSASMGRRKIFLIGIPIWIVVQIGLWFVQPGQINLVILLSILAGIGVSLGFLIPWSLLPDVVDHDELRTGQRREGVFYGFFVFLQKFGIALGLFVQGQVLEWAGYVGAEGADIFPQQPDSALLAMRFLMVWVPVILLIGSMWLVYKYPFTRKKLQEMQAELVRRREAR